MLPIYNTKQTHLALYNDKLSSRYRSATLPRTVIRVTRKNEHKRARERLYIVAVLSRPPSLLVAGCAGCGRRSILTAPLTAWSSQTMWTSLAIDQRNVHETYQARVNCDVGHTRAYERNTTHRNARPFSSNISGVIFKVRNSDFQNNAIQKYYEGMKLDVFVRVIHRNPSLQKYLHDKLKRVPMLRHWRSGISSFWAATHIRHFI